MKVRILLMQLKTNKMKTTKENDVYKVECKSILSLESTITFKYPEPSTYIRHEYDWYMSVALEKSDKVKENRNQLTRSLLLSYRWAIREGFNHMLDPNLRDSFDHPRNRNTIQGIKNYIKKIEEKSKINES